MIFYTNTQNKVKCKQLLHNDTGLIKKIDVYLWEIMKSSWNIGKCFDRYKCTFMEEW